MRLVSFSLDGVERLGCEISEAAVIDFAEAAAAVGDGASVPTDMIDLIKGGPAALDRMERFRRFAESSPEKVRRIPKDAIHWRPPVPQPGKICCVAMNNSAADDRKISAPDHPAFFMKSASCLIGHNEPIEVRDHYGRLHPEPELAVVLGRRAKDLDPARAYDSVFGYTILDDITGNDMRSEDRVHYYALYPDPNNPDDVTKVEQHLSYTARYKSTDTFGPCGPWLVTRDDVPDPHRLDVRCSVGGEMITEDNTRHLTYTVAEVLAFMSRFLTLEPGDIVSMGTAFRHSKTGGRPLHTADLSRLDGPVDVTIETLGTLSNPVRRRSGEALPDWRLRR